MSARQICREVESSADHPLRASWISFPRAGCLEETTLTLDRASKTILAAFVVNVGCHMSHWEVRTLPHALAAEPRQNGLHDALSSALRVSDLKDYYTLEESL